MPRSRTTVAKLEDLAQELTASQNYWEALRANTTLVQQCPEHCTARLALGDNLIALKRPSEAKRVYRAAATVALKCGHPLLAWVAGRTLESLGDDAQPIASELAMTYGRGSSRLAANGGSRLQVRGGQIIAAPRKEPSPPGRLLAEATAVGCDTDLKLELPDKLLPIRLLSQLTPATLLKTVNALAVRRLPAGHTLIRKGQHGQCCYLVARGTLSVCGQDDAGTKQTLASLAAGAIAGEMALITGGRRTATVTATSETDVVEIGPAALAAMGDEIDTLAPALDTLARSRWLQNLLSSNPVLRIFAEHERQDLLERCSAYELPCNTVLFKAGEAPKGLYLLLQGQVRLRREHPRQDTLVQPGAAVGLACADPNQLATLSAKAVTPATVLFLSRRFVRRLIAGVPAFAQAIAQVEAHRASLFRTTD